MFVLVALLLSTGVGTNIWPRAEKSPNKDVGVSGMLISGLIYLVTLYLLSKHCKQFLRYFLREWPLAAFVGIASISALWSDAPVISFRHGLGLFFTLLFGMYIARRFSLREQLGLLVWVCGICMVLSFIYGSLGLGTSVDVGDDVSGWYGAFSQKNTLGEMMALSAIVFLLWWKSLSHHKWPAIIGFAGSTVLVILSNSRSSQLVLALLIVLTPLLGHLLRRGIRRVVIGLAALVAIGLGLLTYFATHLPQVTEMLGKSVTLSGRLQLWVFSVVIALQKPWLGYGYNAFWTYDWRADRIQQAAGWAAPHAHNGFLEIWLEIGLCGLAIFLAGLAFYFVRSLKFCVENPAPEAVWPLLFLVFVFAMNFTEVPVLNRNSPLVVLYASAVLSTAPDLVRKSPISRLSQPTGHKEGE